MLQLFFPRNSKAGAPFLWSPVTYSGWLSRRHTPLYPPTKNIFFWRILHVWFNVYGFACGFVFDEHGENESACKIALYLYQGSHIYALWIIYYAITMRMLDWRLFTFTIGELRIQRQETFQTTINGSFRILHWQTVWLPMIHLLEHH